MVEREHGNEHDVNSTAVKRTMSSSVIYLEQFHMFCGSFSSVVATSFAESWERGDTVTMYTFLFVAIPGHNDLLREYSVTPPVFNKDPAFNA